MPVDGAAASSWDLIDTGLAPRIKPVICQVAPNSLCILGGDIGNRFFSDGVVIDSKTGKVTRVIPETESDERKFHCLSLAFMESENVILADVFN